MFRVLIVEDDSKIAEIIAQNLQRWGYQPALVDDFEYVVDEFSRHTPDLVLMDVILPYFDGFYWCERVRRLSQVPIIFISSRNTNMDIVMAVNMGADDYITKPFSLDVLMAKVNAVLRRAYSYVSAEAQLLKYRGAVLNLNDSTLTYLGEMAELTRNEFRILQLLMKQHGTIVSRAKLMRALWEDESFVDDNTLTVNVSRLRSKLAELGLENFIQTKKNQGYIVS